MTTVIKVENLYKEYHLGVIGHGTLYWDLQSWWANVRGKEDPNSLIGHSGNGQVKDHILALSDINLDVRDGEVLGIIGRNGAGKSTLLKILSRITSPSSGIVKVKGRIASLLEVGTGFHPELTGRENIYLNGAINGMGKREVSRKLDEIVDFAGVENFLDTPVKRYSSGMNARLGFAVAAHLEPDILVVDEVLSVGDYEFQKRCITKMNDVASQGRTILFVSHNLGSVRDLCSRAILLEKGCKIREGETADVLDFYTSTSVERTGENGFSHSHEKDREGNEIVRLKTVRSMNCAGVVCYIFTVRDNIYVQIKYDVLVDMKILDIQVFLINQRNETVFFTYDDQNKLTLNDRKRKPGQYVSTCKISQDFLNDGSYTVMVKGADEQTTFFEEVGCSFDVSDSKDPQGAIGVWNIGSGGSWPRVVVRPKLEWDVKYNSF
jgi:lipopolysaccharide transport system ATP-binding protein